MLSNNLLLLWLHSCRLLILQMCHKSLLALPMMLMLSFQKGWY